MATFTEIYYNGNEYKQMWLNGTKVWEKDSGGGEIVYPYPDVDSVITYRNTSYYDSRTETFTVIDSSLPYSINGASTNSYTFPYGETKVKLINLKPITSTDSTFFPTNIEQLRIPKLTNLNKLFYRFRYDSNYTYSWSPQYFEFHPNPTNMSYMFFQCKYLTDDMMAQFIPHLSNFNTSQVTSMSFMFENCSSLTSLDLSNFNTSKVTDMDSMFENCSSLTSLDLSNFDTSQVTSMHRMFENCSSLTSLDLSNFDTRNVTGYNKIFGNVKDCTIYIGENWTWETYSTFGSGSNLTFIRPIKSITLKSSLADGIVHRGDKFTITPNIIPSNYLNDLIITYDNNYLSKSGNTYTVLNTAIIGQETTITYSSKANPSINATYVVNVQAKLITNITLESTLTDTAILKGTQFTITPTIMPTDYSGDELVITYDTDSLSIVDNTFTVLDTATIGQQLDITYSSKNNPSVSTTYSVTIRDFATIESIVLQHTLESLTDVAIGTTFTVVPTVEPLVHDDELLVDYDTNYLSKDGDNYTVLSGASGQTVQVIYYSKNDNNINAMLEFTVAEKQKLQPLDQWKADLVPLEWDALYSNYKTDKATSTYDLTERSVKMKAKGNYVGGSGYIQLKINGSTTVFDSTKFYKLSYKVRGKDTVNGYSSSTSSFIYDGNTHTFYKASNPALSETEWTEYNFVVYGITEFRMGIYYSSSGNWIEVKDVMYQVYDEAPSLPDIDIYQSSDKEYLLTDLYNQGLVTDGYNSATIIAPDGTNTYIGTKLTSTSQRIAMKIGLPLGRRYVVRGMFNTNRTMNTIELGDGAHQSANVVIDNRSSGYVNISYDDLTIENMREFTLSENEITNVDFNKAIYVRSLEGKAYHYLMSTYLDNKWSSGTFMKYGNVTITELE